LREINPIPDVSNEVEYVHDGFKPEVEMRNVSFTYPSNDSPTIRNVNLTIKPGSVVAIVGPSGAGKSTLADLLLGIIEPNLGEVLISGESPEKAIETWPGAIAYVSQDSIVATGTISTNISLGFPPQRDYGALFTDAINLAQLSEFISELPNKELTQVGDAGSSLSGGQRQRIGIARAMFTKPKLLVLDEATSSLDGETESNISEAVKTLRGDVTVVMIAHRLSTVREADVVIYFENGSVVAVGNFEEVRALVPNFDSQAKMMGL
jgi:ABC-type multidrug transport system fused ATPase/permease subunit